MIGRVGISIVLIIILALLIGICQELKIINDFTLGFLEFLAGGGLAFYIMFGGKEK